MTRWPLTDSWASAKSQEILYLPAERPQSLPQPSMQQIFIGGLTMTSEIEYS